MQECYLNLLAVDWPEKKEAPVGGIKKIIY